MNTIASIVWEPIVDQLAAPNPMYRESQEYLHDLLKMLEGDSSQVYRVYLNFDFRDFQGQSLMLGSDVLALYDNLAALVDYVRALHDPGEDAISVYNGRRSTIVAQLHRLPRAQRLEDEKIYNLVIREVAAVVSNIFIERVVRKRTALAPQLPYVQICEHENMTPNLISDVIWARRALEALAGKNWLTLTWQLYVDSLQVALL